MKTNAMHKRNVSLLIGLIMILTITGCTAHPDDHRITTSPSPTATQTPFPFSEGSLLLIQTGFNIYQIIDVRQQIAVPFDPPGEDKRYALAELISPSGRFVHFPDNTGNVLIMDFNLTNGQITYELNNNTSLFQPETAAEEALESLPGWDMSYESMLPAVQDALIQSRMNIHWYKNDRYLLSVLEDNETSTHLYLNDLYTETHQQLEGLPGLVQDIWIAPDEGDILLKKGFIFEPNFWQDDKYYLVNVDAQSVKSITLPQDTNHPSLSWLGTQYIGITHQTQPLGGIGFTVINTATMESTQIIDGIFSQIHLIEERLLVLKQDQESKTTTLERMDFDGQCNQSLRLGQLCVIVSIIDGDTFINCETESLIIDETFQTQPFGEPIFLLAPSPDRQSLVLVTRNEEVFLLDGDLKERQPLALDGIPLEVRWLPDSSGFLYRTRGKLYHYDLQSSASHLLVTSDLFTDYSNTNAVWIIVD